VLVELSTAATGEKAAGYVGERCGTACCCGVWLSEKCPGGSVGVQADTKCGQALPKGITSARTLSAAQTMRLPL
jgi:hypothetical protein